MDSMPRKFFISYRRDDSKWQARETYRAFERVLGRDGVFMDVDSIPPGANLLKILKEWVRYAAGLDRAAGLRDLRILNEGRPIRMRYLNAVRREAVDQIDATTKMPVAHFLFDNHADAVIVMSLVFFLATRQSA